MSKKKSLTELENKIMDLICQVWNMYQDLPRQHPDELEEFRHGIHYLQGMLMQRCVVRDYPDEYFNLLK